MYKKDCPNCIGDGYYDTHCPYCDDDVPKEKAFPNKSRGPITEIKGAREQTMKELEPVKEAIVKVVKERPQRNHLLRYAEFAGIPQCKDKMDWLSQGNPRPAIVKINNKLYLATTGFMKDWPEWTDKTYLGKLVIADACLQSEKWPGESWIISKEINIKGTKYHVAELMPTDNGGHWWKIIATRETWADAVLAAVEEVGK